MWKGGGGGKLAQKNIFRAALRKTVKRVGQVFDLPGRVRDPPYFVETRP